MLGLPDGGGGSLANMVLLVSYTMMVLLHSGYEVGGEMGAVLFAWHCGRRFHTVEGLELNQAL
jgi:hypothetical protein